jgi:hypothetical protein
MGCEGGVTGWVGAATLDMVGSRLKLRVVLPVWISFDLWLNFEFRLRPCVYFFVLGLSL